MQEVLDSDHFDLSTMLREPAMTTTPVRCALLRGKTSRMGGVKYDFYVTLPASSTRALQEVHWFSSKKASAKDVAYEITLGDDPRVVSSKGKGGDMAVGTIRSDNYDKGCVTLRQGLRHREGGRCQVRGTRATCFAYTRVWAPPS